MTVHYVYGVLPSEPELSALPSGPGGAAVRLVRGAGLTAAVSELPEERYGEEQFRAHAEDPVWLQELATAHHRVLAALADDEDVVPLRMPTLCRTQQRVVELLEGRGPALRHALVAVRGRQEWGVKLYAERQPEADQQVQATSGRDYLGQRMAQGKAREDDRTRRGDAVRTCHDALASAAVDAVVGAPQDPALTGRREPMVLNGAYLVDREAADAFHAVVREQAEGPCREAALQLELTGPWPAYNFSQTPDQTGAGVP
ncbi:MAG: GvpL/GvpF family gas vesicle protein [Nocardioides sp.]